MFIYPVLHTLHTVHLAEMVHALLVLLLPLVNVVLANRLRQLGAPTQVKAKAFNLVKIGSWSQSQDFVGNGQGHKVTRSQGHKAASFQCGTQVMALTDFPLSQKMFRFK